MTIKEQIQNILDERNKKARILKDKKNKLERLQAQLATVEGLREKAAAIKDETLRNQYMSLFDKVDLFELEEDIYNVMDRLDAGILRFERDYISIATVGKARQGKSTFLQAVGNLGNDIIPAFDNGDCTGATSVIYNDSNMVEGTVSVRITFKGQDDLINIVKEYINRISPEYLNSHPIEFNKIRSINIAELRARISEGEAEKTVALEHLSKIVKNFNSIRGLFGSQPITLTDPEKIKTFVAQNNGKKVTDPEIEYYYNYLAVSRADIFCKFYEDCGKIVLVDTVGLGDIQVGIVESMLHTVDKECDAAIVVTKPISTVHEVDMSIYQDLRRNFGSRNMEQWLFYCANHHSGVNDNAVDTFVNGVKNGNFGVCDCRKVNCSDKYDVNENFIKPMLEKLLNNMDSIDKAYLQELNAVGRDALKKCEAAIAVLPKLDRIDPGQEAGIQAYQAGQETYKKMTAQLKNQVLHWKREKDLPNSALWNKVQRILNGMDNLVPKAEVLQRIMDNNGAMFPNNLWEIACSYVRSEITDRFNSIDSVMEVETINFKNSLVQHMYYALKNILPYSDDSVDDDGQVDMLAWLKNIIDNVFDNDPTYRQIYKAFLFLNNFEFSIRENIIQEIRRLLYSINPIADGYVAPAYNFSSVDTGEQVYYYLTSRLAVIEDELRHAMFNLYKTPNRIFYAAAEEFYDRLTFAIDLGDGNDSEYTDMSLIWGRFFMQYNQKLWEDNAEKYNSVNEFIAGFNEVRDALKDSVAQVEFN